MPTISKSEFDEVVAKIERMKISLNHVHGKWTFCADRKESEALTKKLNDYITSWIKERGIDPNEFQNLLNENPESRIFRRL